MKFNYIFEKWSQIKGTNTLTKEHLANVRDHNSDFLIDILEGKYYDAEENTWKDIEGDG